MTASGCVSLNVVYDCSKRNQSDSFNVIYPLIRKIIVQYENTCFDCSFFPLFFFKWSWKLKREWRSFSSTQDAFADTFSMPQKYLETAWETDLDSIPADYISISHFQAKARWFWATYFNLVSLVALPQGLFLKCFELMELWLSICHKAAWSLSLQFLREFEKMTIWHK